VAVQPGLVWPSGALKSLLLHAGDKRLVWRGDIRAVVVIISVEPPCDTWCKAVKFLDRRVVGPYERHAKFFCNAQGLEPCSVRAVRVDDVWLKRAQKRKGSSGRERDTRLPGGRAQEPHRRKPHNRHTFNVFRLLG